MESISKWVFGEKKNSKEIRRKYNRSINRSMLELKCIIKKLEGQEKSKLSNMKTMNKQGQKGSVEMIAKQIVRSRKSISSFYKMISHMETVKEKIDSMSAIDMMAKSMRDCSVIMMGLNCVVNLPSMQSIANDFKKQNDILDVKEDEIDKIMNIFTEGNEEDEKELVSQIMIQTGITLENELNIPSGSIETKANQTSLEERLNLLKL